MKLKRIITLVLAAVTALTFTGCLGHFYGKAGDINGVEISSGLYLIAEYTAYTEASTLREDTEKNVLDQQIEGQNAASWIEARTEELLRTYVCVRALARQYELIVENDTTAYQEMEQAVQMWPYIEEMYAERGISAETFSRYTTAGALRGVVFRYLYGAGGPMAVPDEQLRADYAEQYAYVRYISIPLTSGADGVDMREELAVMGETMVEKLRAGASMEEIAGGGDMVQAYELLLRDFDPSTAASSIVPTYIKYSQPDSTLYMEGSLERLQNTEVGDYGLLFTTSQMQIYEKQPVFEEDAEFEAQRSVVLSALMDAPFEEYLQSIYNAYEVNWVFGAKWHLSPKKVALED